MSFKGLFAHVKINALNKDFRLIP